MTPQGFSLGWDPDRAKAARAEMLGSGRYATVSAFDPATLPKAFSLSGKRLRSLMQGQAGTCFPPGTRVRMADGSQRKIEEIRPLEEVVTAEGNTGRVMQLMARDYKGVMVGLKLWGHSHLKMTTEHPVFTRRGYVKSEEIVIGDWVAIPRYAANRTVIVQTCEHVNVDRRYVNRDRKVSFPGVVGRGGVETKSKALPDLIHLTPGVGRILGFFLAEGSTDAHKVVWTFANDEAETLVRDLAVALKQEWDVDAHVVPRPENHSIQVRIYGLRWPKLFESFCASGAGRKRVHPDLMSGPPEFLEAMFQGWMAGDGCMKSRGEMGATISHDLALNMFDIANAFGLRPSILLEQPQVNRHAKTRQPVWKIAIFSDSDNYRIEQDEKHVWRRVRGVEQEDYSGVVFNIGVQGDNSYVAEGIGVHNCWVHSATQLAETSANALGYTSFKMCRRLIGWQGKQLEGGGNPTNGGDPTDALVSMTADRGAGIAHEDLCPYTDDAGTLGSRPPSNVFDDAKASHLVLPVSVNSKDDARALIAGGHGTCNGMWWPQSFDSNQTFMDGFGNGQYGHSLFECGYMLPGVKDSYAWWELDNWHGETLYPALPPEIAAIVPGYGTFHGGRTSSFWIRDDTYDAIKNMGNFMWVSATDLDGLKRQFIQTNYDGVFV